MRLKAGRGPAFSHIDNQARMCYGQRGSNLGEDVMSEKKGYGVTMDAAVEFAARQKGLRIEGCTAGDVVTVETVNSTYTLRVIDPASRKVEVRGTGEHFMRPVVTYVNGSSMTGTGSMVRLGWIGVGFRLWLGNVLLSETRRILVNGVLFQKQDTDPPSVLN